MRERERERECARECLMKNARDSKNKIACCSVNKREREREIKYRFKRERESSCVTEQEFIYMLEEKGMREEERERE